MCRVVHKLTLNYLQGTHVPIHHHWAQRCNSPLPSDTLHHLLLLEWPVCIHNDTSIVTRMRAHTHIHTHTVFIRIEIQAFISYKWLLTRCLYEPLLHFTWAFISFRVLNPGGYLSPGIYMSPASIRINTVHTHTHTCMRTPKPWTHADTLNVTYLCMVEEIWC